jgi:hypothetical protein
MGIGGTCHQSACGSHKKNYSCTSSSISVFLFPFVVVLRGRRVVACGELCVCVVGDGQTRFLAFLALFASEIAYHVLSDSRPLVFYEAVSVGITRVLSATVRARDRFTSCVSSLCQSVLPPPAFSTGGDYAGEPGSHANQCQPITICTGAPTR